MMLDALVATPLQIDPTILEPILDPIIDVLVDITGKNTSLYTLPDITRFVVAVVVLGYAAIRNSSTGLDHAWKALYIVGVPLLLYTMIFRGSFSLVIQAALNIIFVTGVSVFGIKTGFLSNDGAKLLTGVALLLPTYPYLTVFPLERSILPLPFNMFAFTILFYFAILVLVYGTFNIARNREFEDAEPLFRFIGRPAPTEELHETDTLILQGEHGIMTDLTTTELRDYLEWSDTETIKQADKIYAEQFAKHELDELPDDEIITAFQQRLEWLSNQDHVWVLRKPGLSRFLFVSTLLAMLLGDILFHLIF